MGRMDALRTEFLCQALTQGTKAKLACREGRGCLVTAQCGGRTREDECAFLSALGVRLIVLEGEDCLAREAEGRDNI
jgi:hypothetical protein